MSRNISKSYLCFGVALFLFLFASVGRIKLVGDSPGALTNQKAIEIANNNKGLWPVLANFGTSHLIDSVHEHDSHLIRYVGVAYLGNILIMFMFLITGLLLRISDIEK